MQMKNAEFLTLDPDKTIWKGVGNVFESILYKFTESIPMMVPTMLPGAVLFRAGLSAKAIVALGASEGVLSVGFIANDIEDGIMQIYTEKGAEGLAAEAPNFATYLETMDEQTALMRFIAEAQGIAPIVGGIAVGAVSAAAGKYVKPVFDGTGGSWMGRIGRGAVSEGIIQEGPQESIEQMTQNIAAAVYDGDRDALEGVAESYIQGMVVGMPGGGLFGGLAGKGGEIDPATEPQDADKPDAPSSFRDVFGEPAEPPDDGDGWRGAPASDLFPTPIDITDEAVPSDQAAAIAAALRTDEAMGDMVENIESQTPEAQAQQNLPMPGGEMTPAPVMSDSMEVEPVDQVPPGQQRPLPIGERNQYIAGQRGRPTAPPVAPVPGAVAPVPTEQQGDLLQKPSPGPADQPTAEPLIDIQAQLEDLFSDETDREGVYLSTDNLARLERDELRGVIGEKGVHLVNFDDIGGLLIAKNAEVAAGAQDMKDIGMPMQAILGQLTRAGDGKPTTGTVVQIRNEAGAVVRETVIEDEDEAFAMAERIGDQAVVLTAAQALKRRKQLIAKEQEAAEVQAAIRKETPHATAQRAEAQAAVKGAKGKTKAAARLLGLATKKGAAEKQRSIAGFYPPDTLEFASPTIAKDYRKTFEKLVTNQLQIEELKAGEASVYPIERRVELNKEAKQLKEQLGKIRQIGFPKRKTTRVVRAAKAVDVSTVSAATQEASKRAKEIDTSQQDYFIAEEFKVLDRQAIDKLRGAELTSAFGMAAYWVAGQYRNVEITPEWLADNPEAAEQEIATIVAEAKGDPLKALAREYDTPGKRRKLIRRAMIYYKRRAYGGKIAARGMTAKTEGRKTKSEYDTGALTQQTAKQDESRADQLVREARSSKARKLLLTAVRQSARLIQRFEQPRSTFGKAVAEVDSDGRETQTASDLRVAKAYFVALNEFAMALVESGQTTNKANDIMERLDKRLRQIAAFTPQTFAAHVSKLARADEQSSLLTIRDRKVRAQVTDPATRANTLLEYYEELMLILAGRSRLENVWKKNAFYNNLVGPLMAKFVDSISLTGWASYRPNEMEMEGLAYAMRGWRLGDERVRKELYDPLKQFFSGVGITFQEEKKKGAGGDVVITRD
ncbi:hypothetical protein LCGC14_1433900, partial [marine sediment metagenome]